MIPPPGSDPVRFLPGVGPKRAALLEKLGIRTTWDLLWHLPRTWLDRSRLTPLSELRPAADQTVRVVLESLGPVPVRRGLRMVEARLRAPEGPSPRPPVRAVWFNQPFLARTLSPGQILLLHGPVRVTRQGLSIVHPEYEVLPPGKEEEALSGGRIVPVYPLTAGVTQKMLRLWMQAALHQVEGARIDPLPESTRARLDLAELIWALQHIHFPEAMEETDRARARLAFDEFLTLQLAFGLVRDRSRPETTRPVRASGALGERLRASLPFTLTRGQEKVWEEIRRDLGRERPMNRLLQGDVGSGKTVVAALACLQVAESGGQAVYLAPTEILAAQQAHTLKEWFEPLGVRADLLLGRTPAGERRALLASAATGRTIVLVGTHALLEDPVEFRRLSLVVVDEQHRFGVLQRARLREKGARPHCLVMSATPIPRTLSLVLHGDLDVSQLREMPAGRQPPHTRLVDPGKREDLLRWVADRLRAGEKAFFVYPLVEESEMLDLRGATETARQLASHPRFAGIGVGLLHGRMKAGEKERALEDFRRGKTPCLVATTVVEVGVDVPSAGIMVVEHPERFGLSQLHQLRGRVGRGGGESWFFLMKPSEGRAAAARLGVLAHTQDGFRVAEEDLKLRGPGELLGTAQHGLPEFRAADLIRDPRILMAAREESQRILEADPQLSEAIHARLRAHVLARFGERMALADIG